MEKPSSRLGNVTAAWLVLAGVVLLCLALVATLDQQPVVGSTPRPPTHWTTRLAPAAAVDERDEPETRYNRPTPAPLEPGPASETAALRK